jgi:glycosyltransferase involved in cell wall biosynthesis
MTESIKQIHSIAVVMTTYNGGQFLVAQIDSILHQTLAPTLLIVCDDGSTDQTTAILNKYQEEGKLIWHANKEQLGVAANFKQAIGLVPDGFYFALADQDDIWDSNKLEMSLQHMLLKEKKELPCLVYADLRLMDTHGNILNNSFQNELGHDKYIHTLDTLLFGNFVLGCTCFCNPSMKSYIAQMPISKSFNHDAWLALAAYSLGVATRIKQPLVSYRKHLNNVTISSHTKKTRGQLYKTHFINLFKSNDYLSERFELVQMFMQTFSSQLSDQNLKKMSRFIALNNKTYWRKKVAFEKAFFGKWIKRMS